MQAEHKQIPKLKLSSKLNIENIKDVPNSERIRGKKAFPRISKQISEANVNLFYLTNNSKNNYYTSKSNVDINDNSNNTNDNSTVQINKENLATSRNRMSPVERQKALFNKLYGISNDYLNQYKQAQRSKDLPLEEYQNNLLRVLASNHIDQNNIISLNSKFRDIRAETKKFSPLPQINIEEIERYAYIKKKLKIKRRPLRDYILNNTKKDNYEKEFEANGIKYFSKPKPKRNKIYNLIPLHLVDAMEKKMKFHL